jgi:hypothetical protein
MNIRPCLILSFALAALTAGASEPVIGTPGPEEYVSSLAFYRPSIATDSKAQPHFVSDPGGNNQFAKFHRVNGTWSGGIFATGGNGGKYNASRLYIGQIEIDGKDRAWISCKFGAKEYGNPGQGIWLFSGVATSAYPAEQFFKFVSPDKGNGGISTDAKYPDAGIDLATGGNYVKLDDHGNVMDSGSINAGPGGEKVRFRIASYAPRFPDKGDTKAYPDGIWHTAMNGYSVASSAYQSSLRYMAGLGPVTWASYSTYPSQGSDYTHPGVGVDLNDPRICYMGSVFNGKLCVNIWDGTKMLFPATSLKVLDYDAAYEMRHTIQFAPAPAYVGGTFVIWSSNGRIKLCYLSHAGVAGAIRDITAGSMPGACVDRYGNLHLVYSNGGIRYRKIPVQSVAPLSPVGRITDTRQPLFHWAGAPGAALYTLEITQDGVRLPRFVVTPGLDNSWLPATNYPVGSYSWRLKQGGTNSSNPWSASAAFVIPPALPTPLYPAGYSPIQPVIPTFGWQCPDTAANRFTVQLFQGENLLGAITMTPVKDAADFTADWTNNLTAGSYGWRVKSTRVLTGHSVSSDWSDMLPFQLGVPGVPAITNPVVETVFPPATASVPVGWTAADGALSYDLKVLRNDKPMVTHSNLLFTDGTVNDAFTPAYYTLLVRGVNAIGKGPWSEPVTFIVERRMTPDGTVSNRAPAEFKWTRSEPATRYLLRILQFDAGTGKYVEKRTAWIGQPAAGNPRWTPPYIIPNGKFRWTLTDFNGSKAGYTQSASFQIRNSGHAGWNDPALIVGTWKVLTSWRWVEMSFQADGVIRTVQGDGAAFTRARWSADDEILTMVSDVTERCPYTVTENTLTFTLPSGNVKELIRK